VLGNKKRAVVPWGISPSSPKETVLALEQPAIAAKIKTRQAAIQCIFSFYHVGIETKTFAPTNRFQYQ
jgi:hypothetical protein